MYLAKKKRRKEFELKSQYLPDILGIGLVGMERGSQR